MSQGIFGEAGRLEAGRLLGDGGPVVGPGEIFDPHIHGAVLGEMEGVEDKEALAGIRVDVSRGSARAAPFGIALEEDGPAAVHHGSAGLVGEGAVRAGGAADGFFVVVGGGIRVAAVIDGDEQVVVAAVMDEGGAFDGVGVNAGARGEVIAGGIG
jgi:hypothetical protein